jgi:cell division control protein 6
MSGNIFDDIPKKDSIILNSRQLEQEFIPKELPHRRNQIEEIVKHISPALKGERPQNLLIYGKTGVGKTAVMSNVGEQVPKEILWVNLNCYIIKSEYSLLATIHNQLVKDAEKVPHTGWSKEKLYDVLKEHLKEKQQPIILVLDELDKLVLCKDNRGNDFLYKIFALNEDIKPGISIIGITNYTRINENLEDRTKNRLNEDSLTFPPYNALQLTDILQQRAETALKKGSFEEGVITLCAAYAAQRSGDARTALRFLRNAARKADSENADRIIEEHVNYVKKQVEYDAIKDAVGEVQDNTHKLALLSAIAHEHETSNEKVSTGQVYDTYQAICKNSKYGLNPLSLRQITDFITEFDERGIISAKITYNGRYGRTRYIYSKLSVSELSEIIKEYELKL